MLFRVEPDPLLKVPSYGLVGAGGSIRRPTLGECIRETAANINVFRSRRNLSTCLMFLGFAVCGSGSFAAFVVRPSLAGFAVALAYFYWYTVFANTTWRGSRAGAP